MVPPTLIEKKKKEKRGFLNITSHGVGSMKQLIESKHTYILITYVVSFLVVGENMPSSEKWNDGSNMDPNQSKNVQS
jgi:hypothetical protein